MKANRISTLIVLLLLWLFAFSSFHPVSASPRVDPPRQDEPPTGTPTPGSLTPADIISAVNSSRTVHGLNTLTVHPALMAVAADQASALALSEGSVGHERPCGMSLGQDLLSRGFPLLGDLSMDGYRSENWVETDSMESAMAFWMSDEAHRDTILDENRSHIGAAVATSASGAVFIVLETALSTSSGQMQYDAYSILTGIPQTQAACYGMYTQAATMGVSVDQMLPVVRNTARPDGDVIHEVQYGQTLWSIAIQYGTTIEQIRRLNNLPLTPVIYPGQKLLIQKNATQPAPTVAGTEASPQPSASTPSPTVRATFTATSAANADPAFMTGGVSGSAIVAVVFAFLILAGVFVMSARKRTG